MISGRAIRAWPDEPVSSHALKIDHSFVPHCATDPTNRRWSRRSSAWVMRWAGSDGRRGRNPAELVYLREQGCDRAQGWLFSPPVTAAELPGVFEALQHFGR